MSCNPILVFNRVTAATLSIDGIGIANLSLTEFNLPGIDHYGPSQASPYPDIVQHSDKAWFEPLFISFAVTNNFESWIRFFNWMNKSNHMYDKAAVDHDPYKKRTGVLTLYDNSNKPIIVVKFIDLVPLILSSVEFKLQAPSSEVLYSQFSAQYSSYTIEVL